MFLICTVEVRFPWTRNKFIHKKHWYLFIIFWMKLCCIWVMYDIYPSSFCSFFCASACHVRVLTRVCAFWFKGLRDSVTNKDNEIRLTTVCESVVFFFRWLKCLVQCDTPIYHLDYLLNGSKCSNYVCVLDISFNLAQRHQYTCIHIISI